MFTETELRDALQHSAARADDLHLEPATPAVREPRGPRRRWALPVIAAATVAAFAFGVAAVVGAPENDRDAAAPAAPSAPSAHLVDRAVAGDSPGETDYRFEDVGVRITGGQTISRDLGSEEQTVRLTVLPGDFASAATVERGTKVGIAGTDGWFARRTTYLLDGEAGGKDTPLPFWTIAFRTPGGDWAFARIDTLRPSTRHDGTYDEVSLKDAARIVAAYDGLDVEWVRDGARQPLRFGSLPDGARLVAASYTKVGDRVSREELGFTLDGTSFRVQYGPRNWMSATNCASGPDERPRDCPSATRSVAGGVLKLQLERKGLLDTAAVLRRVVVATDPDDYVGFEQAVSR